jgi:hypothetical protein
MRRTALVCITVLVILTMAAQAEEALVVWQHLNPAPLSWEIWYADLDNNFTPTTAQLVPGGFEGSDHDPAVAYDRAGNAMVVWAHDYGSVLGGVKTYGIVYSRRAAGSTIWSAPDLVALDFPYWDMDPAVAFDENGNGLCVWVRDLNHDDPSGPGKFLYYSRWDPNPPVGVPNWSQALEIPRTGGLMEGYRCDTARTPELAFTSIPGVGGLTSQRAVVVAGLCSPPFMVYNVWDGSNWGDFKIVENPGVAVGGLTKSAPYSYYSDDLPALHRLSVASDNNGKVLVAWRFLHDPARLWYSYFDPMLPQTAWIPNAQYTSVSSSTPAVVVGPGTNPDNISMFTQKTGFKWFASSIAGTSGTPLNGTPQSIPVSPVQSDFRPSAAWVTGTNSCVLAVWAHKNPPNAKDIYLSRWVGGAWGNAVPLVTGGQPGGDRNPDIAAKSGSHTMPPLP